LVLQQQNCGSRGDDGHRKGDAGRQDTDCRRHAANVRAGFDRVPDDNAYECRAQEPRRMMIVDDFEQPFAGDGRFAALPASCAMFCNVSATGRFRRATVRLISCRRPEPLPAGHPAADNQRCRGEGRRSAGLPAAPAIGVR
jgi:hypothetical protein